MNLLLLSTLILVVLTGDVYQSKYVNVKPGQNSIISVAPLSVEQAQMLNNYAGASQGYTYNWLTVPSWGTASGSSFSGSVPSTVFGKQQMSVKYTDSTGNAGIFSFTLNYDAGADANSAASSGNSINIVNSAVSGNLQVPSGTQAQLVLIPRLSTTTVTTTTTVTANTQVTKPGDGSKCNSILDNLNSANNVLATATATFSSINNQLNNVNNTLINLNVNQTTLTQQIQRFTAQATIQSNNISTITSSITTIQVNITSTQNNIQTINARVQNNQNQLNQLKAQLQSFQNQQQQNNQNIIAAQTNVSVTQNALDTLNSNIQNAQTNFDQIQIQFTTFQTQLNSLNNYISKSNARVQAAQN